MSSSQPKPTETSSQSQPTGNNPSDQPDERSAEMLCLVNKIRSEVSKKPLKLDSRLMKSSQKHSEDQAEHKKMSHDGTKVKFFFDRIKNEGFRAYTGAENVAWNQKNVEKVVQAWKKSEGHYKNIIGEFECFGWGEKDLYWTQNFAAGEKCDDDYVIDCSRY
ncbi:hypothetical protein K502DRAFT_320458 [Neoconidiobolus thromboides FSU 785]|nr:hypothetical protein K502DRAFT_320458 [Neoconidiobolus thromboides FSU 785]